ncbi:protein translocase subunit SecF [Brevundimonas sp. Root1279]|uniref:protein translocase subunit SecF n=1 Tax=Brevundimonas sp. Root1279 TaxID=1736443 RepID=UPI0006FDD3CD|nr:protein translocase subunit SecF [Brevundimonas sp. Root1279]KQW83594.1 preprotein translocase subunit SecF [Brevundimonas sp. Root1279]
MAMRGWPLIKLLPQVTNFRFVRLAKFTALISVVLCVASLVGVFTPGLNMGIDFRGGATMEVIQPEGRKLDLEAIREGVEGLDIGEVGVQEAGAPELAMVRFQIPEGRQQAAVVTQIQEAVTAAAGPVRFSAPSIVGSKVSGELFSKGLWALASAIGLMFLYIWFRFEPQFGFGAVAGLLHDVILCFGLIVVMKLEFNLNMVAAILTVIGYSMNDTVVVFDRLRENLRKYKSKPLKEVIDLSINETLSRTIITGLTAVMVLAALAFYGGPALFGFSVILMFGIVVGTYSSIYVGAPIILLWGVKRGGSTDDAKPIKLGMASRP